MVERTQFESQLVSEHIDIYNSKTKLCLCVLVYYTPLFDSNAMDYWMRTNNSRLCRRGISSYWWWLYVVVYLTGWLSSSTLASSVDDFRYFPNGMLFHPSIQSLTAMISSFIYKLGLMLSTVIFQRSN